MILSKSEFQSLFCRVETKQIRLMCSAIPGLKLEFDFQHYPVLQTIIMRLWTSICLNLLVASLLSPLLLLPGASGEVYSSASDMKEVFRLERELVSIMDGFATKLQSKLDKINAYLEVCSIHSIEPRLDSIFSRFIRLSSLKDILLYVYPTGSLGHFTDKKLLGKKH